MRPLNQSHQRRSPQKFSRMQASSSKFCGTKILSSLIFLHFNSGVKVTLTVRYSAMGKVRISIFYHAARIYN
jgi:hypothetical protein